MSLFTQPTYLLTLLIVLVIWATPDVVDSILRHPQGEHGHHPRRRLAQLLSRRVISSHHRRRPAGALSTARDTALSPALSFCVGYCPGLHRVGVAALGHPHPRPLLHRRRSHLRRPAPSSTPRPIATSATRPIAAASSRLMGATRSCWGTGWGWRWWPWPSS